MNANEPSRAAESHYSMANVDIEAERGRLNRLEHLNDAATLRRVDAIGVDTGWRCVEIGAGAGSIARALADRVGADGLVLATDQDPRFLDDFNGPGREVATHDIMTGPVPPSDFDLAHCRAVLAHVEDIETAVRNMAASLRPGGWVLCEEPDYGAMEAIDPDHPHGPDLESFRAMMTYGPIDGFAGRHTFSALREAGVNSIETDTHSAIAAGGSPRAQFRIHGLENSRSLIMASGFFGEDSVDRMIAMFNDPTFAYIDNTWIATWGQVNS